MRHLQRITLLLFVLVLVAFCAVTVYDRVVVDHTPPVLSCDGSALHVSIEDPEEALLAGLTATDNRDGDLTGEIRLLGISPMLSKDTANATYVVFDRSDNMATCSRLLQYDDYRLPTFSLSKPLVYGVGQPIRLRDRLTATDVLDGDLSDQIQISSQNIVPNTPRVFQLTVHVRNSRGDVASVPFQVVVTDGSTKQHIFLEEYLHYVKLGSQFDPASLVDRVVTADNEQGDPADVTFDSDVDLQTPGAYTVQYFYESNGETYTTYLTVVVE